MKMKIVKLTVMSRKNEDADHEEEWNPPKRRSAPVKKTLDLEASYDHEEVQRDDITVLIRKNSPRLIATLGFILFTPHTETVSSCMGIRYCSTSG
jgi:hypothetical protein